MSKIPSVAAVLFLLLVTACSKPTEGGSFSNDLKGAPVQRGGIPDDSIKPAPVPTVKPVQRGGVADDGVKPAPTPTLQRGGIPDDSIKPKPGSPVPVPPR